MPINSINYANIPAQGDPILDAIGPGLMQGLKLAYAPKQMQQQLQNEQLKNALAQIQLQYAPQLDEANIASKNAYANNLPIQNQIQQAQLAALLQKLNQNASQPSPFQQKQDLAKQQAQLKASAQEDKNWDSMIKDAHSDVSNSNALSQYADQFSNAYDKSSYKGQREGAIPSRGFFSLGGAPEQEADMASQNMVATKLALMKGRFTNYGLKFIGSTKPDRTLTPEAKKNQVDLIKANSQRMSELLPFLNQARQQGLSSSKAQELWDKYQNDAPFIDPLTGSIAQDNLGKWKDFLAKNSTSAQLGLNNIKGSQQINSDQATRLSNFLKNSHANTASLGGPESASKNILGQSDFIMMRAPDGQNVKVHKSRLKEALSRGLIQVQNG